MPGGGPAAVTAALGPGRRRAPAGARAPVGRGRVRGGGARSGGSGAARPGGARAAASAAVRAGAAALYGPGLLAERGGGTRNSPGAAGACEHRSARVPPAPFVEAGAEVSDWGLRPVTAPRLPGAGRSAGAAGGGSPLCAPAA